MGIVHRNWHFESFVEQLEKDGIGSDGLTTKLERLEIAIKYCCREGKLHLSSEDFYKLFNLSMCILYQSTG